MQKTAVATALLAATAHAVICRTNQVATAPEACGIYSLVSVAEPPNDVVWTTDGDDIQNFGNFNGLDNCWMVDASLGACADALSVYSGNEANADELACLDKNAAQGASPLCGLEIGATCTGEKPFCALGSSCKNTKCAADPIVHTLVCQVQNVNALSSPDAPCTIKQAFDVLEAPTRTRTSYAGYYSPTVTFTPSPNVDFATFFALGDSAAKVTCETLTTVDSTLNACVTALGPVTTPAINSKCIALNPAPAQGAAADCGLSSGEDCSATAICKNDLICGADDTCMVEPSEVKEVVCAVSKDPSGLEECKYQADFQVQADTRTTLATLITPSTTIEGTKKTYATFYPYVKESQTPTCADLIDASVKNCAATLTPTEPTQDDAACIAKDAKQGASKACPIAKNGVCVAEQVCANDLPCTDGKCAVKKQHVWTKANDLADKAAFDAVFPATKQEGKPCSGLGLAFYDVKVYPQQAKVYFSTNGDIPKECLDTLPNVAALTTATTCGTTCGPADCFCEKDESCTATAADPRGNCLDGFECDTTTATCQTVNSSVVASAALAVAVAVAAIIF